MNEQKGQSDDIKRIYSRIKNKFGSENCFVSGNEKISDCSLSETLAGIRVLFESMIPIKNLLSNRVKQRKSCGFHISSTIGIMNILCCLINDLMAHSEPKSIKSKIERYFSEN
jgi:hypothetical protein